MLMKEKACVRLFSNQILKKLACTDFHDFNVIARRFLHKNIDSSGTI